MAQLIKYSAQDLIKAEEMCRAIDVAQSIDECRSFQARAAAFIAAAKKVADTELQVLYDEVEQRAKRRIGELIQAQKETVGLNPGQLMQGAELIPVGPPRTHGPIPTLASAGINKRLAHESRTLARMTEPEFKTHVASRADRIRGNPLLKTKEAKRAQDREFRNYGKAVAMGLERYLLDDGTAKDLASIEQSAQLMNAEELELARRSLNACRKLETRVADWIKRLSKALKEIDHEPN
jgi:hypothetical protein